MFTDADVTIVLVLEHLSQLNDFLHDYSDLTYYMVIGSTTYTLASHFDKFDFLRNGVQFTGCKSSL